MTVRIPVSECPTCHEQLGASSGLNSDEPPCQDDVAICFHCGEFLIFTAELTHRYPTDAERVEILADPELGPLICAACDARRIKH